jgi:hypothetical protein
VRHLHGDHFGGVLFCIVEAQLLSKCAKALVIADLPGPATRLREAIEAGTECTPAMIHRAAATQTYARALTIKIVFAIFCSKPCFYTLHILRCRVVDALDGGTYAKEL